MFSTSCSRKEVFRNRFCLAFVALIGNVSFLSRLFTILSWVAAISASVVLMDAVVGQDRTASTDDVLFPSIRAKMRPSFRAFALPPEHSSPSALSTWPSVLDHHRKFFVLRRCSTTSNVQGYLNGPSSTNSVCPECHRILILVKCHLYPRTVTVPLFGDTKTPRGEDSIFFLSLDDIKETSQCRDI